MDRQYAMNLNDKRSQIDKISDVFDKNGNNFDEQTSDAGEITEGESLLNGNL
jgi:hypothetical protein